jgi:hypothetical protein
MTGVGFAVLRGAILTAAVMLSALHADAENSPTPALLPIGRLLLQDALAAEKAGTANRGEGDLVLGAIPAAWFPLPSCAFPGGLCGAVDRNGAVVVAPAYDWVDVFRGERAIVRVGRFYGAIDSTGRVIVPVEYEDVEFFSGDLFRVVREGVSGLIDFEGRVIAEPRFSSIASLQPDRLWLMQSATPVASPPPEFLSDAKRRRIPGVGRSSLRWSYFSVDGKATLIDRNGSVVREFPHIEASPFDATRALLWAKTDLLWGLMKAADGDWLLAPQFEDVRELSDGLAAVKLEGKWGYVDSEGRVVISPRFGGPGFFGKQPKLGRQADAEKQLGLIDRAGQWVIEPRYEQLFSRYKRSDRDLYWYWVGRSRNGWDILNESGEVTGHIEGMLDQPPEPCEDGRILGLRDKQEILFDATGHALLPPEGRLTRVACFEHFIVKVRDRAGVVDAAMQWIVPPKFETITALAGNRLLAKVSGKYGIVTANGRWILDPVYDHLKVLTAKAETFMASRGSQYGLLGIDGAWLIEPRFEDIKSLSNRHYAARVNGKYGVLMSDGTWLLEPTFDAIRPLDENLVVARVADKDGAYDAAAKTWVIEPRSDELCGFQGKYAIGITDGLRTLYDAHTGAVLIGPHYNRLYLSFADGLIPVRVDDKWGYADLHGDLVIPAQFHYTSGFRHGIAWATHEGKMCPLDRRGHWVEGIPCVEPDPRELDEAWHPPPLCGH